MLLRTELSPASSTKVVRYHSDSLDCVLAKVWSEFYNTVGCCLLGPCLEPKGSQIYIYICINIYIDILDQIEETKNGENQIFSYSS